MRRARLAIDDLAPGERRLDQEAVRYLVSVLRLRDGDTFTAFDPKARRSAEATLSVRGKRVYYATIGELGEVAPTPRTIEWIHGLAKGTKNDAIVRDCTELGATSIVFAVCTRSVTRSGKAKRWQKIAIEAARQSGRIDAPTVTVASFADAIASGATTKICFYEDSETALDPVVLSGDESLAILAGPEGGLEASEVHAAEKAGFAIRSLGERILRTETVPAAVLGAVLLVCDFSTAKPPRAPRES